jgi:hypothetical protein
MGYLLPENVLMISVRRSPSWRTMPMSLHAQELPPVPEETRRVARAAFPRGNVYMRLRDELGAMYDDQLFASLFPIRGQPAASG